MALVVLCVSPFWAYGDGGRVAVAGGKGAKKGDVAVVVKTLKA